ncbi:hypothetical protein BH160DRAFT_0179 [Burkholderia sp. H160]|nr:hypothetical protein BH160DRAFT_0179 [Burkholderia sp. H160]
MGLECNAAAPARMGQRPAIGAPCPTWAGPEQALGAPFRAIVLLGKLTKPLCLLSWENLNRARALKKSKVIQAMSSPVLDKLRTLIRRGEAAGTLRKGIDPLHQYVTLVSLAYFHRSNAYTLSRMFDTDMLAPSWHTDHTAQTHELVRAFLTGERVLELT